MYVDNIAMINNVCEEVDDKNDQVYVGAFASHDLPETWDQSMEFVFDGGGAKMP